MCICLLFDIGYRETPLTGQLTGLLKLVGDRDGETVLTSHVRVFPKMLTGGG